MRRLEALACEEILALPAPAPADDRGDADAGAMAAYIDWDLDAPAR